MANKKIKCKPYYWLLIDKEDHKIIEGSSEKWDVEERATELVEHNKDLQILGICEAYDVMKSVKLEETYCIAGEGC